MHIELTLMPTMSNTSLCMKILMTLHIVDFITSCLSCHHCLMCLNKTSSVKIAIHLEAKVYIEEEKIFKGGILPVTHDSQC